MWTKLSACSTPISNGNLVKKDNIVQNEDNANCLQSNQGYGKLEQNYSSTREVFKGDINAEVRTICKIYSWFLVSSYLQSDNQIYVFSLNL